MPVKKITFQDLLDRATELFRRHGYHATSIDKVARACDIKKASVYHYVRGKEALALKTLNAKLEYFREHIFAIAYDDDLDVNKRLREFADEIYEYYKKHHDGCLMTNLMLEIFEDIPELEQVLKDFFNDWVAALQYLYSKMYDSVKALKLAQDRVAELQGALIMRIANPESQVFDRACQTLANSGSLNNETN